MVLRREFALKPLRKSLDIKFCVCDFVIPIDFYGQGPLRDKNGMCVPHEANNAYVTTQTVLLSLILLFSFLLIAIKISTLISTRW